jgi:hypothetical protein
MENIRCSGWREYRVEQAYSNFHRIHNNFALISLLPTQMQASLASLAMMGCSPQLFRRHTTAHLFSASLSVYGRSFSQKPGLFRLIIKFRPYQIISQNNFGVRAFGLEGRNWWGVGRSFSQKLLEMPKRSGPAYNLTAESDTRSSHHCVDSHAISIALNPRSQQGESCLLETLAIPPRPNS